MSEIITVVINRGPAGSAGTPGAPGAASTVPGPTGPAGPESRRIYAQSGRNALIFGGSALAQHYPPNPASGATYTRGGGFASIRITDPLPMLAGQRFRLAALGRPDVEGMFVLSQNSESEAGGTRITWVDARAARTGLGGGNASVIDMRAWAMGQAWAMYANGFLGAPWNLTAMGTGGAGTNDWLNPERLAQFDTLPAQDAIMMATIGNDILGGDAESDEIIDSVEALTAELTPKTRILYAITPPTVRALGPTDVGWIRGSKVLQMLYAYLPKIVSNLKLVHVGENQNSFWSPPDVATPADVLAGHPDTLDVNPDNVHYAFNASLSSGLALANGVRNEAQPGSGLPRLMSDNKQLAPLFEAGEGVSNLCPAFMGFVDTVSVEAPPRVTGVAPVGASFIWTNGGSATVNSSMQTFGKGGSRWVLDINDTASSPTGCTLDVPWSPPWLLSSLIAAEGKELDLIVPVACGGWLPNTLVYLQIGLFVTIGGVEYPIVECLADRGENAHQLIGRGMAGGFAMPLRAPRGIIPLGTKTAARFRWRLRHTPASSAPNGTGRYRVMFGPAITMDTFAAGSKQE